MILALCLSFWLNLSLSRSQEKISISRVIHPQLWRSGEKISRWVGGVVRRSRSQDCRNDALLRTSREGFFTHGAGSHG